MTETTRFGDFDPTTFLALGEGLAAGVGEFGLHEELQAFSFPAQIARQMNTPFPQPLMQAPGIGGAFGFPDLPVRVPAVNQTTVLEEFPPARPLANLSVPGLTLADALEKRPVSPLVHRTDALQTSINLILGLPGLLRDPAAPRPTQLEYAAALRPSFALVELGYYDVLSAAAPGDPGRLPPASTFRERYTRLLQTLRVSRGTIVVTTIPDPADTPALSDLDAVARLVRADAAVLRQVFDLAEDDRVTVTGLMEIGCRLLMRQPGALAKGSVIAGGVAKAVSERVRELNRAIVALAEEQRAIVYDLHALFARMRREGVPVGARRLTGDFLGGFYSLSGAYPGATGHALIANGVLDAVNAAAGTSFPLVDVAAVAAQDPVASYRPAGGPAVTLADLAQPPSPPPGLGATPLGGETEFIEDAAGAAQPEASDAHAPGRLRLPPGLVQVLPVDPEASYFGDFLRAVYAADPHEAQYGATANLLFGGLAMVQSHVTGRIRLTFTPPVNDVTHFEVTHGPGLVGDDAMLVAPQFFSLPCLQNRLTDAPGLVSSGDLNLATGDVTNLSYNVLFTNSALFALGKVNPRIPPTPVQFPGQYGSAWAKFEQRPDGKLDFSFAGTTFLPLGADFAGEQVRFPLPFAGPTAEFASIPAPGTALHPHLRLSTKPGAGDTLGDRAPELPTNTIREYLASSHNSAFGDEFTLNIPELGGNATGRSHLTGRVQIQFGARTRNSVPISVSTLMPGAMLAVPPSSPLAAAFPGRLSLGLIGHDETLRFPKQDYAMRGVAFIDDPFELTLGSVDLTTGQVIGDLLYRGFIIQNLLAALVQIEPRTPRSTFFFRGPSRFEKDESGQTVFGFNGRVRVPYPEGFLFPTPDFETAFTAGPGSALDPFLYIEAMEGATPPTGLAGEGRNVEASSGERFSYTYLIPGRPEGQPAMFEYTNHTRGATFRMSSLAWVGYLRAVGGPPTNARDTVSFTAYGRWSGDAAPRAHIATVQISTSDDYPYVSIVIDGGLTSNVNTKPAKATLPLSG